VLSTEQLRTFAETGVVTLPGAVASTAVAAMRARIWQRLGALYRIRQDDPGSWHPARPSRFQTLTRSGAFAEMRTPALVDALDQLLGGHGWLEPTHWGPPLVSFPDADSWDVPTKMWHLDDASAPARLPAAVRAFVFLTPVRASGGATVAVLGSYRVLGSLACEAGRALRSAEARSALATCDPWFAGLEQGGVAERARIFMAAGACVRGVAVRVQELCGEPGDITLMRADTLHALGPHVLPEPRFVVAQFIYRRAAGSMR